MPSNNFTYNENIPNPPNNPSNDVGIMQTNAQAIDSIIAVDHVGFNTDNGGSHNQITFAKNQSAPSLANGVSAFFANTIASNSWPFFENSLGNVSFFTGLPSASQNGYVYLQGGIIIQWGKVTASYPIAKTPLAFATNNEEFPNNCFGVWTQITYTGTAPGASTATNILVSSVNETGFSYTSLGGSSSQLTGFFWIAIGN
jgi:hypothetical protein